MKKNKTRKKTQKAFDATNLRFKDRAVGREKAKEIWVVTAVVETVQ